MALTVAPLRLVLTAYLVGFASVGTTYCQSPRDTFPSMDSGGAIRAPSPAAQRVEHLWTMDYVDLLMSDTGAIVTAPVRWQADDWTYVGLAAASVGAAATLDRTVKDHVQAHRTSKEDRYFKAYQNLGSTWSFGVIAAFDVWGEATNNATAKDTAMDALTASIIGPGLIGTSVKYAVGRVRPNSATGTFTFKPFSNNQSFPSGHTSQAFAVATAIAENYPSAWVQALCYSGASLVGYARIEQNAHYTSDVVAGALLGWAVAREVVQRHQGTGRAQNFTWVPYATGNAVGILVSKSL